MTRAEKIEAAAKALMDYDVDGTVVKWIEWDPKFTALRDALALPPEEGPSLCRVCGHPSNFHLFGFSECLNGSGADDPKEECQCPAFTHPSVVPSPEPSADARRQAREERLRAKGFEEPASDQRKAQLAENVAPILSPQRPCPECGVSPDGPDPFCSDCNGTGKETK